ncbi:MULTISPECIES: hypothetical protein [unclassified Pseudomonas]|uniref:hypothetical protein n=1 Tax=unclassified Pseudomonas TaxID=196821 RepID=UPI001112F48F|nr:MULTISPECIES: hypothetical protein [unclassified Pseudomonas]
MHEPPSVAGCGMVAIWLDMGYQVVPARGRMNGGEGMLGEIGNIESSSRDSHNGVAFTIRFFKYPNGYMTEVHVDGLPVRKDDDNCWKTKEEAHQASVELAHKLIEKQVTVV